MDILILYIGEGVRFDREAVSAALHSVRGTYDHKENTLGSLLECRFDWADDSTIVRLTEDQESISLSGSGDASLKLALELQASVGQPLRLVDSDYSFDLPLSEVSSVEDLRSRMSSESG